MPQDRVLMYDASTGGIYATATPAQLTAAAAVDYAAAAGAGGNAYIPSDGQTTASPAPAGNSEIWNPELDVDVSPSPAPAADGNIDTPPLMDVGSLGGRRRLLAGRKLQMVQTPDERVEVSAQPTDLPTAAVGQLLAHGQEWHCSASLIAERTIITAGELWWTFCFHV